MQVVALNHRFGSEGQISLLDIDYTQRDNSTHSSEIKMYQ